MDIDSLGDIKSLVQVSLGLDLAIRENRISELPILGYGFSHDGVSQFQTPELRPNRDCDNPASEKRGVTESPKVARKEFRGLRTKDSEEVLFGKARTNAHNGKRRKIKDSLAVELCPVTILDLPNEMILKIVSKMKVRTAVSLLRTCKTLNNYDCDATWAMLYQRDFGAFPTNDIHSFKDAYSETFSHMHMHAPSSIESRSPFTLSVKFPLLANKKIRGLETQLAEKNGLKAVRRGSNAKIIPAKCNGDASLSTYYIDNKTNEKVHVIKCCHKCGDEPMNFATKAFAFDDDGNAFISVVPSLVKTHGRPKDIQFYVALLIWCNGMIFSGQCQMDFRKGRIKAIQ
jgi:hypothetical protein